MGPRGGDQVLRAGGAGVAVLENQQHRVVAVEQGALHAREQAVVPEPAVTHDGQGAALHHGRDARAAGQAHAVAQDGVAHGEGLEGAEGVAADVGGHVQVAHLLLRELQGGEHRPLRAAHAEGGRARRQRRGQQGRGGLAAARDVGQPLAAFGRHRPRQVLVGIGHQAARQHFHRVLAAAGQQVLAVQARLHVGAAQVQRDLLLQVLGLTFLGQQHGALAGAEAHHLLGHHGVGHVHHQHGDLGVAAAVGQAQLLHRALQRGPDTALHDQAQLLAPARHQLVQAVLDDVAARGGNALLHLQLLLAEGDGRVRQAHVVEARGVAHQRAGADGRRLVVLGGETAAHMAGADAQLQQHRHVGGFGQAEAFLHHLHQPGQVRARVQQAHAALERIGVGALLDHRGTLAVVLAHHDERAAHHARRRQVGQRVRRHIGADDGFPGHRAAQRVVEGRAQHGRGRGLVRAGLHVHAQGVQVVARLHHHVQQVRHRRALVAAHVRHARLQQRLGHGQDALAVKGLAGAQLERFDFLAEGDFHGAVLKASGGVRRIGRGGPFTRAAPFGVPRPGPSRGPGQAGPVQGKGLRHAGLRTRASSPPAPARLPAAWRCRSRRACRPRCGGP